MAAKRIKIDNASSKFRRQSQKREQKVIRCSVLIVCEGTKTEPNYFEAFAEKQQGVIVFKKVGNLFFYNRTDSFPLHF